MHEQEDQTGASQPSSSELPPIHDSVTVAERIQVIIDAAEKAAAGIIEDAEAQARRYLQESRRRAEVMTAERTKALTELTDALIEQAETVKRQSEGLIAALDEAKGKIEERVGPAPPEPALTPLATPPASNPEKEGPQLQAVEPRSEPRPPEGAKLLATQMAVAGSRRAEIESRLLSEYGIRDAGTILDSILGPEG